MNLLGLILITIQLINIIYSENVIKSNKSTLKLVHVIFRHGDRTPTQNERYPTDPQLNNTYHPFGVGQLTTAGKKHSFTLGKQFRNRYDAFLGSEYYYGLINSTATSVERTQATLQCVHAGLFPYITENEDEDDSHVFWQPIPYEILPPRTDTLLLIEQAYPTMNHLPKEARVSRKTHLLYDYVSYWTGIDRKTMGLTDVSNIYDTILVKNQLGYPIPAWAEVVYPEPLRTESLKSFIALQRYKLPMVIGHLIERINAQNHQKVQATLKPSTMKMYLYSCHDTNIAALLGIMQYELVHTIKYNAHIFIELHEIDEEYFVKIFYKNGINGVLERLKLRNCDYLCPLEKFTALTEWLYIPTAHREHKEETIWEL
ncbi:venom acid phosphatase Acph-1-like [Atheta coriaria]|uniref:venom acid phosphatase Acph-1-like n=1 Tax=Dalotia coriaria TaxID=877792 RepID=UPI0031F351FD